MRKLCSACLVLTLTTALVTQTYAANNKLIIAPLRDAATGTYNQLQSQEQYKLEINKGAHVNNTHLELLPVDGELWVPKDRPVKIIADCDDGYKQGDQLDSFTLNEASSVDISAIPAPSSAFSALSSSTTLYAVTLGRQSTSDSVKTATYTINKSVRDSYHYIIAECEGLGICNYFVNYCEISCDRSYAKKSNSFYELGYGQFDAHGVQSISCWTMIISTADMVKNGHETATITGQSRSGGMIVYGLK